MISMPMMLSAQQKNLKSLIGRTFTDVSAGFPEFKNMEITSNDQMIAPNQNDVYSGIIFTDDHNKSYLIISHMDDNSGNTETVVNAMEFVVPAGYKLVSSDCTDRGYNDGSLIALIKYTNVESTTQIKKLWRYNYKTNKIYPLKSWTDVRCLTKYEDRD